MNRAQWTKPAQADFARIDEFYSRLSPAFAELLGAATLKAARFLSDNPRAGSVVEDAVRKWRIRSFDYVLLYRIVIDGVEILRMHHARENWRPRSE